MDFDTTIVIPAYNEEKRLIPTLDGLRKSLKAREMGVAAIREVLVVDDGSQDRTIEVAKLAGEDLPSYRVIESSKNFGKGHAIRMGIKNAKSNWVLVADADMSTPWKELAKLCEGCSSGGYEVAIGSRDLNDSQVLIRQSWVRENLGKSFNLFVRKLTGLKFRDTQCGFKLFHRESVGAFLDLLQVNRFAWDVEFLMFANIFGLKVVEVPVVWEHRDESRVRPVQDGLQMLCSVARVRAKQVTIEKRLRRR